MGANCLNGKKSSRQIGKSPQKILNGVNQQAIVSQNLPESVFETPKKKLESYPSTAGSGSTITAIGNSLQKANPEDLLISPFDKTSSIDPQQQQDIWAQSANARSSIIRLSSRIKRPTSDQAYSSPRPNKDMLEKLKACQMFEGELTAERFEERMTISIEQLNIEFMLPRCRAGPIVVPFIDYANYAIQQ